MISMASPPPTSTSPRPRHRRSHAYWLRPFKRDHLLRAYTPESPTRKSNRIATGIILSNNMQGNNDIHKHKYQESDVPRCATPTPTPRPRHRRSIFYSLRPFKRDHPLRRLSYEDNKVILLLGGKDSNNVINQEG